MSDWTSRMLEADAAELLRQALAAGLLNNVRACLFHDLPRMRARISALQSAFPAGTLHAVAIKANPLVEVLREAVTAGAGLEAASLEEVYLAQAAGCPAERIVFDSPAKTRDEIQAALRMGLYLNADNLDELARIGELWSPECKARVGIRVNPEVGKGSIAITSVAGQRSKFGLPLSTRRAEIVAAYEKYLWLTGLHIHVGSQGCQVEMLVEAARRVVTLWQEIGAQRVTHVDIGGGLPVAYRSTDRPPELETYVSELRAATPELFDHRVTLLTEFGRSVQANCGLAASRVEYVKDDPPIAVVHLGADFLMRPVYHPQDWPHEYVLLDPQGQPKTGAARPTTLAGPLCFGGDLLARDLPLPPVAAGDWLLIRDVGAYTLSMWSRHCSRGLPLVLGYDPAAASPFRVLLAAETPDDVVRFWSRL